MTSKQCTFIGIFLFIAWVVIFAGGALWQTGTHDQKMHVWALSTGVGYVGIGFLFFASFIEDLDKQLETAFAFRW